MHRYLSPQIIKFVSALKYNPVKQIGKLGLYVFSGVAVTFLIMTFIAGPKALAAGNPLTISLVPPNYYSNYYYEISIDGTVTDTTPGATINPISWNWGDHTSSVSGWPAVHSYNNTLPNPPQTYPVTATVTDSNGQIASASEIVQVPPNRPYFVVQGGDVKEGLSFGPPAESCIDYYENKDKTSYPNPCSCSPWNGTMFQSWNNEDANDHDMYYGNSVNGAGYYGGAIQDAGYINDTSFDVVSDLDSFEPILNKSSDSFYNYLNPPATPSYLNFANFNQGQSLQYTLDYSAGYYGGYFDDANTCQTEKFVQTMANVTTPLTSSNPAMNGTTNTVNLAELTGGNYSYTGTLYVNDNTDCGCNMAVTYQTESGIPITIAVNGNVYIKSNIIYSYPNPSKIPQVNIYAGGTTPPPALPSPLGSNPANCSESDDGSNGNEGNIFVAASVTEIHGNFTAEGDDLDNCQAYNVLEVNYATPTSFTDGLFSDCAYIATDGTITSTADYNDVISPCNNQLQIDGSIGANVYYLERSYGDLDAIIDGNITPGSTTNAQNAAEVFQYSPEVWIPDALDTSCSGSLAQCIGTTYESVTSLPPSL